MRRIWHAYRRKITIPRLQRKFERLELVVVLAMPSLGVPLRSRGCSVTLVETTLILSFVVKEGSRGS